MREDGSGSGMVLPLRAHGSEGEANTTQMLRAISHNSVKCLEKQLQDGMTKLIWGPAGRGTNLGY